MANVTETFDHSISPPQTPPAWSVIEFCFSSRNTDSELVVMCSGKRFVIRLSADNFSESPRLKARYLFFLQVAEEFELDGVDVEDFWDWAVEPLLPLFRQLPPLDKTWPSTLDEFLSQETFFYTLRAVSDELVPEQDENCSTESRFGVLFADELCAPWNCFSPSEIRVCEEKVVGPPSPTPRKVLLNDGTITFFKFILRRDKQSLRKELDTYKIDGIRLDNKTRVPRLHGVVRDDSGTIFGLLLTYIDCGRVTLSCAVEPGTPMATRDKWVSQLRDIAGELHRAGIVWGNANPHNVLIDRNQDAWVIDFRGGYIEGWVPRALAGTVEGDCHALEKMVQYVYSHVK